MMDNSQARSSTIVAKINLAIFAIALLSLIASLSPQLRLWGLDSFSVFPLWLRLLLISLLLTVSIPGISQRLGAMLWQKLASMKRNQGRVLYFVIVGGMLVLFVALSSNNHLLGDGYNIQANIAEGKSFSRTEPLDYLAHHLVFLMAGGGEKGAHLSYLLCSYAAGLLFFLGFLRFSRRITDLLIMFAVSLAFASTQFFFGYVESYTLSFVCMSLYLMSAGRDLEKKAVSVFTIAALMLAMGFHLSGTVLIPSFIYLLLAIRQTKAAVALPVILSVAAIGIGIAYMTSASGLGLGKIFVPLKATADSPYHMFSVRHLADLIQLLLLDFPLLVAIPIIYRLVRGKSTGFFVVAAVPAMLFTFVVDPKLGMLRDWDLMSIASAPIMAFLMMALVSWRDGSRKQVYGLFAPLLIFAIIHTGSWVVQNTSKERSYTRIRQYVESDVHYSKDYYKGYRNKSWAKIVWTQFSDMKEVIRADEERLRGDPDDDFNVCNLASNFLVLGDSSKAVQLARDNWQRFVNSANALSYLGSVMLVTRNYYDAERIFEAFLRNGRMDYRVVYDLGTVEERIGRIDSAFILYDRSFALGNKDISPLEQLRFYLKASGLRKYSIAEPGLRRTYPQIPAQYRPSVIRLIDALNSQNYNRVDSLTSDLLNILSARKPVARARE